VTNFSAPLSSARQGIDRTLSPLSKERRVTMLALTWLIFFTTCGGAYGLEPLIGAAGPTWAIALILVTPLVWSLPTALMAAELTTLMPVEGGYYVWIRETFGPFWAVQQACWTMTCAVVWMAIYPVLFVSYLTFLIPALSTSAVSRWLIAVLVIVLGMALNFQGAREVGRSAEVSAYLVLGIFVLLLVIWLMHAPAPSSIVEVLRSDLSSSHKGALLLGLSIIIFDCSGWENASTYAGEVDQPQRNYPRALGVALLVLVVCYLLPVIAGITVTTSPAIWSSDAGWPVISQLIGGRWLGGLVAVGGLVSMWGLFNGQLLYISRLPYVLACDGWLPGFLGRLSPEAGVPGMAILCFGVVIAIFAALSFGSLAIIQCLLYAAGLTLEFLALLLLRVRRPDAHRSFRIPAGWLGLGYVCVAPFAFAALLLYAILRDWRSYPGQLFVVAAVVAFGVALYLVRCKVVETRSTSS